MEYARIHIRDVNSYIAVDTNGKVKRKGAYEYDVEWHQNASSLVVQKVAEKFFLEGANIREALAAHPDKMDFMCRVKVPRSSHLIGVYPTGERALENTLRYYVSEGGCNLVKVMPPLAKKPDQWRRIGVESGWTVCPCNNIKEAILPIDYNYYQLEVEKLCLGREHGGEKFEPLTPALLAAEAKAREEKDHHGLLGGDEPAAAGQQVHAPVARGS